MFPKAALIALSFAAAVCAQQIGTLQTETHPSLSWATCTTSGGCTTQSGSVTLDSNWRWTHATGSSTNCYTGNTWDATLCPDDVTCAANCALDGADYEGTYGVTSSGDALTLKFITTSSQTNIGSRLYLMASETEYQMFKPLNQEFTFTVDVSKLPCGLNGALYFSEMPANGDASSTNAAGAQYGTGYCDSQCPRDLKFIGGKANSAGWVPSSNSANTGVGNNGACCTEMDIWEANSISTAYTAHPCSSNGLTVCTTTDCGGTDSPSSRYASVCDPDGCDFNSYRNGDTTFYGPGMTVNTNDPVTVVTQFITSTGTSSGTLSEIRRLYVQNGEVIQNSVSSVSGLTGYDSLTPAYCTAELALYDETTGFSTKGGFGAMSTAFSTGMVLVLSLWDDYAANMLWLDSDYPTNASTSSPGTARGTCATSSGVPATVESQDTSAQVIYSNIRFGDLNSTYTTTGTTTSTGGGGSSTSTSSAPGATQTVYGQCGGTGYTGPTTCASGSTCTYSSAYYSQCLPS